MSYKWPKSVKEFLIGRDYGDPKGNPRTCREACCGSTTQVLLCQLWSSFIMDIISIFFLLMAPTDTDEIYTPNYVDSLFFAFQVFVFLWAIWIILKKHNNHLVAIFIIQILVCLIDIVWLTLPIVHRRFVKEAHFVSYTVNQSTTVANDLFIIYMLSIYIKEIRGNWKRENLEEEEGEREAKGGEGENNEGMDVIVLN